VAKGLDNAIAAAESVKLPSGKSFIENSLGAILGMQVTDDPNKIGDTYFYPVGKTTFTVDGSGLHKDTPFLDLAADAELAAAEQVVGQTDMALIGNGVIRGSLDQGKTGNVTFGDLFRVLPLGSSSANGTFGYPLGRTLLLAAQVKAAFEVTAGYSYTGTNAADFYIAGGGIKVEYDTARAMFDPNGSPIDPHNGRVTKMTLASDHAKPDVFDKVIFDLSQGGFTGSAADLFSVAANLYVINFAYVAGISLEDAKGNPLTPEQTIIHRTDGSEVKDWEAVAAYIHSQPNSTVPARYMTASHMVCTGPLCK
jgi:hypothetical protein